jgi:L-lactate dehydrogenase complex protein LldE
MADRKLSTLPEAQVLTSTDAGCLLHLSGRMAKRGANLRVVPLATLLWEAYAG